MRYYRKVMPKEVKTINIHIINIVWGEKYINTFLNLSLPTQFAPGNLTGFSSKVTPHYIIYTTKEGQTQITSAPIFEKLKKAALVEFKLITLKKNDCPFDAMLKYHSDAIKTANVTRSPLIILSPDSILSKGVFSYLENALHKGKRLVAVCSARMSLEKYRAIVEKGSHDWSPQDLAKTAINNLHHRGKCLILNDGHISSHPSQLYWQLDANNLYVRAFHLHPLLIWPQKKNMLPTISVDGKKFLEKICPNLSAWDVIIDCSQAALFEISSDDQFTEDFTHSADPKRFQEWKQSHASKGHLYFAKHSIILGDGNEKPEWKELIQNAKQTLRYLEKKQSTKLKLNFKTMSLSICKNICNIIRWYAQLSFLVLTGKKKLTLKKIRYHFYFLFKYHTFPKHTLKNQK